MDDHTPAAPVMLRLARRIGTANPRLFGSFVEHLGRGVYGGLYAPDDPSATPEGFRGDVLELVRELGVTVVRYPGGNFVSGYDWRDGVGPRDARPRRLDLAWKTIEPNTFGTDEFVAWCRHADVEPMLALNLGLGDTRSALELLEYTNHPAGTTLSDARVANGSPQPHGVRLWCLGNEADGPWQLGHRSAAAYAEQAAVTAAAMRRFDPTLELVVVGSSHERMPTFGTWEREVLTRTIDLVDHLSCHIYVYDQGDRARFLRSSDVLDGFLDDVAATIAHVRAATHSTRDVRISLDEWNVWNYTSYDTIEPHRVFEEAPRILEEQYTLADAVVVGTLLQSILRHADVVAIAAMAQLVNVIGPIRAEPGRPAWRQTTFHPFAAVARSAGHTVLDTETATADDADATCVVTVSPGGDHALVHLANRSTVTVADIALDLRELNPRCVDHAELLWTPDPTATNTADNPDAVAPRPLDTHLADGTLALRLPPVSWATVRVSCTTEGR
ncbi:alpha-L-arabinofuranosidase C-terminal domain-containing protein [Dactylosporangium sp. AC04546]|uniref:alpha-N-arabinofuranosidase n=1 Tax=Dactylosporangium sp. AC04546 TaxID=2862460 RepID=UPI0027DFF9A3|nr:alpha-L-arabinofuranosidase C-terminal domain-containing protein [Dactylosporangium sp. AC04546]WVK88871.1 alpha-L-arabinofuranosidase C-terminal domain-containing protein [Dactylosporangium sp. AC04546]